LFRFRCSVSEITWEYHQTIKVKCKKKKEKKKKKENGYNQQKHAPTIYVPKKKRIDSTQKKSFDIRKKSLILDHYQKKTSQKKAGPKKRRNVKMRDGKKEGNSETLIVQGINSEIETVA
jgi:translation elongation factor EF-G